MTPETGPQRLGAWLDVTMANRGLKNRDLAKEVKVHESAVHNWRKGKNVPQLPTLQRIAQVLGCDPVRLAVTAGLLDSALVAKEPYDVPEPYALRSKQRRRANELLAELAELTSKIRGGEGDLDEDTLAALKTLRILITEGDVP